MRQLRELNINEGGHPVTRRSPDQNSIKAIRDLCDFDLPDAYIKLLEFSNGGHPELDFIESNGEWDVNNFFFIGDEGNYIESVLWNQQNKPSDIPKNKLPFARDGGGNLFTLDLSVKENPVSIFLLDIMPPKEVPLFDSFEKFIDGLAENPDYI